MKSELGIRALLLVVVGCWGCNLVEVPSGLDDNQTQRWQVDLMENPQAPVFARSTADCLPGGACGTFTWAMLTEESFGCRLDYSFEVQFSGDQFRILLGKIAPSSNCSGMTLGTNGGTGTANAAYPAATGASGSVTINWNSPIGPSGGTSFFRAVRVQ